ncbi:hypothetical protein OMR07_30435, partial [Methylobacterium organophilum]|nr:hypothetical protein [Methylobacterium organophilum]
QEVLVEAEPHELGVPRLILADEVAGAAQVEVAGADREAGPEAGIVLRDGRVVWKRPCPDSAACTALATDLLERIRAVRESAA